MIIAIAGKNNIAVEALKNVYKKYGHIHEVVVICNKNETGKNGWQKSLRFWANKLNIKEVDLNYLYNIKELLFLSLEFDQIIIPKKFKSKKLYNIHFSKLPQYKGMYTSILPILFDEKVSGVTLHRIESGIDTGDIVDQISFRIEDNFTSRDLYNKYIENAIILFERNIVNIIYDNVTTYKQSVVNSSYFSKSSIDFSNLEINVNQTSRNIFNQVRAYNFREYQLPKFQGKDISSSYITNTKSVRKAGTIIYENEFSICISTIDYNILLFYDRFNELMNFCKKGDICSIRTISNIHSIVNNQDLKGNTPISMATINNYISIVKYLIEVGADINTIDNNGTTLLMFAVDAYRRTNSLSIFKLFINFGIDVYQRDYTGRDIFDYISIDGITKEKIDIHEMLERLN